MADTVATQPAPSTGKHLVARIVGVLTSPRATYADVAANPRWFGALATVIVVGAVALYLFMSTEVGKRAALEQQVQLMESFGVTISDAQYERIEQRMEIAPYTTAAGHVVSMPVLALVISGLLLAVFNAFLGGDATFKQVFAIVAHSGIIITLAQLFGLPLAYQRETMSTTTNLGVFVQFLDENSFLARFFGAIDLFQVWWIVSLSIGLGVLYKRRTAPIATTMLCVYAAIALLLAVIRSFISGA